MINQLASKPITARRLKYFVLATSLALLSNLLVINLPFSVPFMIGNVVFLTLYLRLGLWWAVAGLLIILLPLQDSFYWYIAFWQLLVVMVLPPDERTLNLRLIVLAAAGKACLLLWLAPAGLVQSTLDYIIVLVLLLANFVLMIRATQFLLALSASRELQKKQLLRIQLSHRIALYSAIPSSLFISLILHSAVILHFNNFISERQQQLNERQMLLEKRLTQYLTLAELAAKTLAATKPDFILEQLVKTRPEFISALTTDATGNVKAFYLDGSNPTLPGTINVAHRQYFYQPQATLKPAVTDAFKGQGLGSDLIFAIGHPIVEQGSFHGVLQLAIALERLTVVFNESDSPQIKELLLDRANRKLWGSPGEQPIGDIIENLHQSEVILPGIGVRFGLPYPNQVYINQQQTELILQQQHALSGWVFYDQLHTGLIKYHYHLFLLFALLLCYFLLEFISRISGSFARQYTHSLERLANYASDWQGANQVVQPPPILSANALEFDTLRTNLYELQKRVIQSQHRMQLLLEERTALNKALEQRVEKRTAELAAERDKANNLAAIKTRFLANMSHEIRTPLTIIQGYIEQIQLQPHVEETMQNIGIIATSVSHLQAVVNDILDTAKLDEGKLEVVREPINITAFLKQLKLSFSGMAGQKNLYLELDNTLPDQFAVLADPFRLQQIFSNLLSNALKFTEQGGITIKAQKVASGLSIQVQDTGIGITAEQKDKLFAAFSQADVSTSRRYGGTGLGLYICKSLADLMGLTLDISSTSGLGTCFTLSFPPVLLDETGLTLNTPENTSRSISRNWQFSGNILIVDDVREIRQLLRRQLQSPGTHISEAEDGNVALTLAKQQAFDLIILDQQMPGLDGFETAKLLRQQGSVAKLVSLSADIYDRSQLNQAENPFDLILAKPISQQRLLEQLQQLFATNTENSQVLPPKQLIAVRDMDLELVELQQDYLEHLETEIIQFRALIAAQSWAELKKASHKLKGTSASLDLVELAKIALDFDTAVAEKVTPEQLLVLCRQIEQQINIHLTKTLNKHS